MRQRIEAARPKDEQPAKFRRRLPARANPFKKLRLGDRKVVKLIKKGLSFVVPSYFVNAFREVRQVQWPNRVETWRLTLAVFIFAIVFGALVAGVDKGLDEIFKNVVLK